jgi:hypothetical protein
MRMPLVAFRPETPAAAFEPYLRPRDIRVSNTADPTFDERTTILISLALVLALAPPAEIAAFGRGASECSAALKPAQYEASFAWVMGYFTGLNTAARAKTGQATNGDGIMAEVQLLCRREPNLLLIDAAERVYLSLDESPS